jgi:hypothetical protein
MPEHALKEWGVTCDALSRGEQVLIVRKGGIGEKRFELPHHRFFLMPTYEHQRPELVTPEFHEAFADSLGRRAEPARLPLRSYAEIHDSHPITDPTDLEAIHSQHILTADYAAERLRWRPKQPLWAVVLRVWNLDDPPVLEIGPEHGGCVSWVALPAAIARGEGRPALDDDAFGEKAAAVTDALAART